MKDIFHVDGLPHRRRQPAAGGRLTGWRVARQEAASVARLRTAGALVVGKTVTTEFAYFAPGPTRNPLDPGHTPGGSSSGSAAGVAAELCALALGTQTIGSIIRPAAFCGIVGYKPSYGLVPCDGVIPLAPSLDHIGCFARELPLLRRAAAVLRDDPIPEYHESEGEASARPLSLGVPAGPYLDRATPPALEHFDGVCARLAEAGLEVRRLPALPDFDDLEAAHHLLVAAEAAVVHRDWFARHPALYHPKTADLIRRGQAAEQGAVAKARDGRERLRQQLTGVMDDAGIDLWISPSALGVAPEGLDSTGDPVMNLPWSYSGLPTAGIPSGRDERRLPFGLQLTGRWRRDDVLLRQAERIAECLA